MIHAIVNFIHKPYTPQSTGSAALQIRCLHTLIYVYQQQIYVQYILSTMAAIIFLFQ